MFERWERTFGPEGTNRLEDSVHDGAAGVVAALETFYYALNHAELDALTSTWADSDLVSIDNPVGGIVVGRDEVTALYGRIFGSGLALRVTLTDVVAISTAECWVVSGQEIGDYAADGRRVRLRIRTSRVLAKVDGAWRLVHHHGSIDDADALASDQRAVRGDR